MNARSMVATAALAHKQAADASVACEQPGRLPCPDPRIPLAAQWVPPHERARAVSLATSGMYLGSAGAMAVLPGLADAWGAGALLRGVAALGFAWLAMWAVVGRDVPYRWALWPVLHVDMPRSSSCLL
jgi:hypothetical protein